MVLHAERYLLLTEVPRSSKAFGNAAIADHLIVSNGYDLAVALSGQR